MDGKTVEQIRNALLDRSQRIGKNSSTVISDLEQENFPQTEVIDIAQGLEQMGRDMSLAEKERRELIAIENALAKMAVGNFGTCEDCGEEISPKRLVVLPEARLCAYCQTYEEKNSKGRGLAAMR